MKNIHPQAEAPSHKKYDFFVFGDSLSDIGNLYKETKQQVPPSPPYNEGRFSNGALTAEILAKQLGLPLSLKTDFAIGGARTDRTNNLDSGNLKFGGLLDEIDRFKPKAKQLGAGAEDLYLVWAGGNDFFKLLSNPTDPTSVIQSAVTNIVNSVKQLAKLGAKNIVVAEAPNLGRVPLSVSAGQQDNLAALSSAFNTALETAFNELKSSLKNKNIILTNLFPISEAVANNKAAFGLTNVTDPLINNPTADPNTFFFWDTVHPTTRGHSIFANVFRDAILSGITDRVDRAGTNRDDRLVGFKGSDRLDGRGGADELEGNGGNDVLLGGSGNDTLIGGDNRDQLTGGAGQDLLKGGSGRDTFIYGSVTDRQDTIADFEVGQDLIDLQGIFRKSQYDRPNRFEAYVQLASVTGGTEVKIDTNGDLRGGFETLVLLSGVDANALTRSSFRV